MQFIDLKGQYHQVKTDVTERINRVLEHGQFIMGPEVSALEAQLADYTSVKHCIGVSSGSDALLLALLALGIGPGDEVITTPFTFIATATMIRCIGAVPVFVDIKPDTYNINPALIESAITQKTKAILPVNLFGQCADYDAINTIAQRNGLSVIEDAAQSFGATYKGRPSCGLGTISCVSFFPSKPLGCYGDGGACFTDDDELATLLMQLRNHGQESRYHHTRVGMAARLDSLQAAILLSKLTIFDEELKKRQKVANYYTQHLSYKASPPYIAEYNTSVFAQYTLRVPNRDDLASYLNAQGIPTAIHYPKPLHHQPIFLGSDNTKMRIVGSLTESERAAREVLSLPFYPGLTTTLQDKIISAVNEGITKCVTA